VIAVRVVPPGYEQPAGADRGGIMRDVVHGGVELRSAGWGRGVSQIEKTEPML